jgi:hypothetical protein
VTKLETKGLHLAGLLSIIMIVLARKMPDFAPDSRRKRIDGTRPAGDDP